MLKLFEYYSCHAKATTLGNGRCWWQRWWPMEMVTAIANSDRDRNGRRQGWSNGDDWQQHKRDGGGDGQQQLWQKWPTGMVMAIGYGEVDSNSNRDGNSDGNGNSNYNSWGSPLHVLAMCSTVAGATPCLHPHGHKGKCIHQCFVMGVTLLRVFAPFQGGGFLIAHHGLFFCYFFTTKVQLTEQPSICPPHYSSTQEPCQPIDALPPPLLQETRHVSLLTIYPGSYCTFLSG